MTDALLSPQYLRGIALFNAARFYECHEVLEELWLAATGDERELLRALIQAAAALHHHQNGNGLGAAGVYARARQKLEALPPQLMRLDTRELVWQLAAFFDAAGDTEAMPPLPQINLRPAP